MFSPDMMAQAQSMMANMKPEDMKRMSDMAANMDPKTMEGMMKNMGGSMPSGVDAAQMSEQMKNMSPEQMQAGMTQAQNQMGAQKQYVYNGALHLKNEGNKEIKNEQYSKALESYDRAIENLRPHTGDEIKTLRLALLSNAALCQLKLKNFRKAMDVCEEALGIDAKAVKPTFRRGLAHEGMGDFEQALLDVKTASSFSPDDKAITTELTRLRKLAKEKGIKEEDLKPKEKPKATPASSSSTTSCAPKSFAPGGSAGSTQGGPDMAEAMEQLSKNPEMLTQAADMMKNMSPEDIQRMMPGADPATVQARMQAAQNPEMFKTAMERMQAMPEDERKKMLETASAMHAKGGGGMGGMAGMGGGAGGMPDMSQAMEEMAKNPDMMNQAAEMMKNMKPEDMARMSDMAAKMNKPGADPAEAMEAMASNPEMMKQAEEMMKNMNPDDLAKMMPGADPSQAKMIGKMMPYMPYILKCMRAFGYVKRGWKAASSNKGRMVIAALVLSVALLQHYRS